MICIFSSAIDITTIEVIRWLNYLGRTDIIRINFNDNYSFNNSLLIDVAGDNFCFQKNNQTIHLKDIEAVWYRKGKNWLCDQFYPVTIEDHSRLTRNLNYQLEREEIKLSEYLHYIIENAVPVLGSPTKADLNKLLVLKAAKEVGLLVPDFFISNNKKGIKNIFSRSADLITKSLSEGIFLFAKEDTQLGYFSYTEKVNEEVLENTFDKISPSFFQKNINKKYEIRVFFLEDTCHSMVIFSQADQQTQIDFRKYNEEKPNRFVPFKLQDEIEQKIKKLFKKIGLNTGSVDLLVDKQNNFYFLEINPVGQFGMISYPCNYFLERKVAQCLIKYATRNSQN